MHSALCEQCFKRHDRKTLHHVHKCMQALMLSAYMHLSSAHFWIATKFAKLDVMHAE